MTPWKLDDGRTIMLVTPDEFAAMPDGARLVCIDGEEVKKGEGFIDNLGTEDKL